MWDLVKNPNCWFSHAKAHIYLLDMGKRALSSYMNVEHEQSDCLCVLIDDMIL